ncbi:MAG: SDR family NAD(P)-dependent oxidoreductase [Aurantibacter sp.]
MAHKFIKRFEGQVAAIVGGARGIGKAISDRLISEGAQVVILDLSNQDFDQLKEQNISSFLVDITNQQEVNRVVSEIVQRHGRLDILINSAGIVGPTSTNILDYSLENFQAVLNTNLTGAFIATKAVLPRMVQNNYGRILHLASIGGKEGNPGMVGYVASKSGLMGLIKGVGKEYADTGITVNGIAPAVIATPMNEDTDPEMLKYMAAKIPMGRLGTIEEVAALACWIVSREASFNTGFIFDLSGGRATY